MLTLPGGQMRVTRGGSFPRCSSGLGSGLGHAWCWPTDSALPLSSVNITTHVISNEDSKNIENFGSMPQI